MQQQTLSCEANFLMRLSHPHIVQGRQLIIGQPDEPWCIIMEAFQGRSIFADLAILDYGEDIAAILIRQLLGAVSYLHAQNILHRFCFLNDSFERPVIRHNRRAALLITVDKLLNIDDGWNCAGTSGQRISSSESQFPSGCKHQRQRE
jgi:hypothetical protein